MLVFAPLLAFIATVVAQAADPSINTPASVVQCQPVQLTWTATRTPVFISIIPGGQPGAAALQDFGQQTGTSLTWTANIASGTSITFQIRDSAGTVAYSAPVIIQSSADSSCLGAGASTTAAGTTAAGTTGAAPSVSSASSVSSTSQAATTPAASTSSPVSTATAPATSSRASASTSRTATATSASTSPTTSNNAASPNAKVGLAGLLGLAAAVVIA